MLYKFITLLAISIGFLSFSPKFEKGTPPNIVVILLDDAEEYDIGAWGGGIDTPWMDFLSKGGKMFKNGYSNPVCSPSRAALVTGHYPQAVGMSKLSGIITEHQAQLGHVNLKYEMISEFLSESCYETYMSGKWHLGRNNHDSRWFEHAYEGCYFEPLDRGFDEWSGFLGSQESYYGAMEERYMINGNYITPDPDSFYQTDFIGDEAVKYVRKSNSPFYLYMSLGAPHAPLQAPQDGKLVQKYIEKFSQIDTLSNLCYIYNKAQYEAGLVDRLSLNRYLESEVSPKRLSFAEDPNNLNEYAIHAAMIEQADINIGKVLTAIKDKGEMKNTLIFLMSDNGGDRHSINGIYDCQRGFKDNVLEGGIGVPFVAFWEGKIKPGVTEQIAHLIDIFPTVFDIVTDYTKEDNQKKTFDGISLKNVLFKDKIIRRSLVVEHRDIATVIMPDFFKFYIDKRYDPPKEELHYLPFDSYEDKDMLKKSPEFASIKIRKAKTIYKSWLHKTNFIGEKQIDAFEKCYPHCE